MPYLVTIGLEVHCQVKTNTKMFCACRTSFGDTPNTHTCPVCLGLPGALPVLNQRAIEKTLLTGLMIRCSSPEISKWDRKNYFYPDMPKNYQTTQLDLPLCIGGGVPLYDHCYPTDCRKNIANPGKVVRLNRIHLEEDVAKSTHLGNSSLIDFNRAGTPLMEIVSEPDLESGEEAFAYLRSLQMILQQGGVSDADMEKGQLRCDVNISLRKNAADPLGSKIELKNLNSISAIRRAIHFEIHRQAEDLDRGIPQIQSTRRWDDDRGETQLMRTKEDAHDYRYFTCPDLLPIRTAPLLEKVRPLVPELPHELAARFEHDFGVTAYDAVRALLGPPPRRLFRSRRLRDRESSTTPLIPHQTPRQKSRQFHHQQPVRNPQRTSHRHRRLPGHPGKTPRPPAARGRRHPRRQPGQRGLRRSLSITGQGPRRHRRHASASNPPPPANSSHSSTKPSPTTRPKWPPSKPATKNSSTSSPARS